MRTVCLYMLLLLGLALHAQDKVYFLDGTSKTGKVKEIGLEEIKVLTADSLESFFRRDVLLIEYKNGQVEKYNDPDRTIIYDPEAGATSGHMPQPKSDEIFLQNQVSLNTLALCNSDISGFYERITANRQFGFGGMAAYNFNKEASLANTHIFVLSAGKKNYDLGVFGNYYVEGLTAKHTLQFGLMIKYTRISFMNVANDSVKVGNVYVTNTTFTPAKGGQLATLFTCGIHTAITSNFFIKAIGGIGGFTLRGDYKTQYNLQANSGVNVDSQVTRRFLLKLYFGVNAGFTF